MTLALCRDCRAEYPDTSLADGRCWVCAFGASLRPVPVTGTEPPAPEPVTLYTADPCTDLDCMKLNLRHRTDPPRDVCPHCGGPTLYAPIRRRAALAEQRSIDSLRDHVARRIFVDGDGEAL